MFVIHRLFFIKDLRQYGTESIKKPAFLITSREHEHAVKLLKKINTVFFIMIRDNF